jgi:low affinity Fe/Cu permease
MAAVYRYPRHQPAFNRASARLAVMVMRVAVVVVVVVVVVVAVRTLTGPLGGLSTARLPQVPAAA